MKKFLALFVTLVFFVNSSATAFSFKRKKVDPLDLKEKTEYINMSFWENFEDEYLIYYICEAIKNNHDARKASYTVEEYRQNVKNSFGKELPSLSVAANYAGIHVPQLDNFTLKSNAFLLPFYAQYEPDFLLKNRDKTNAAKKEYEAVKFDEKAVYISLASDVGTAYINLLQYDKLIALQKDILKSEEGKLSRALKKFESGVIDTTELNVSQKALETAKNDLETMEKNRDTVLTQLAVLIGA